MANYLVTATAVFVIDNLSTGYDEEYIFANFNASKNYYIFLNETIIN